MSSAFAGAVSPAMRATGDGPTVNIGSLLGRATFPGFSIAKVGGGTLNLPEDLKGSFGVILIYREAWCPYCNAQLAGFERLSAKLADGGVKAAAFSVDDEETTAALVEKHRIHYPAGFGTDADAVAAATGAYVNAVPQYLQSTGFVLAPRRRDCHRGLLVRRDRTSRSRRRRGSGRLHQVEGALG